MCALFSLILIPLIGANAASPTRIEKMTVSKMRMADLETSASGYSYNKQQGLPVSYIQYTNHGSNLYYDTPKPLQFISAFHSIPAPLPPAAHQIYTPGVVHADLGTGLPYSPQKPNVHLPANPEYPLARPQVKAVAPYYTPDKEVEENKNFEVYEDYHENGEDDLDDGEEEVHLSDDNHGVDESLARIYGRQYPGALIGNHIPDTLPHYGDIHDAFEHSSGKDYEAEKHDEHGQVGKKGYKGYQDFDHGEKSDHSSDDHRG